MRARPLAPLGRTIRPLTSTAQSEQMARQRPQTIAEASARGGIFMRVMVAPPAKMPDGRPCCHSGMPTLSNRPPREAHHASQCRGNARPWQMPQRLTWAPPAMCSPRHRQLPQGGKRRWVGAAPVADAAAPPDSAPPQHPDHGNTPTGPVILDQEVGESERGEAILLTIDRKRLRSCCSCSCISSIRGAAYCSVCSRV